jgi:hypothetical protein
MKKKKTIKKIESVAKGAVIKTKSFMKKTNKKVSNIASTLKEEWEKEQPQREKLKNAASKVLERGMKISGDVIETIRKDIGEINNKKNK